MHKSFKKALCVLLSLMMVLSVFGGITVAAETETVTVTFDFNDGATPNQTVTINKGAVPAKPAEPAAEGSFLFGWKFGDAYAYYDFATPLTEDVVLTAIRMEGTKVLEEDFEDGFAFGASDDLTKWFNAGDWEIAEEENGNHYLTVGNDGVGELWTPQLDLSAFGSDGHFEIAFIFRTYDYVADESEYYHYPIYTGYRYGNGEWRNNNTHPESFGESRETWTENNEYYGTVCTHGDAQLRFLTDGNARRYDIDRVIIYVGGHDFEYDYGRTEDGHEDYAVVTAYCENSDCTMFALPPEPADDAPDEEWEAYYEACEAAEANKLMMTLNAPEHQFEGDGKSPVAALDAEEFNFYTGSSYLQTQVEYYDMLADDRYAPLSEPPTAPGFYYTMLPINLDGFEAWWIEKYYTVGYTRTYGEPLGDVSLPSNLPDLEFVWVDDTMIDPDAELPENFLIYDPDLILDVGEYWFPAYYEDTGNGYIYDIDVPVRVVPKEITVTAVAASKTEGETDPALTYTCSEEGVAFTGALIRETGEAAGTYPISLGTLSAGGNYTINFVPANFTINAKPEPPTEPSTEPSSEPTTEPTTEPTSEPTTAPAEEPTTSGGGSGSKLSCCERLKKLFCEIFQSIKDFLTYPIRLVGAMFDDVSAGC